MICKNTTLAAVDRFLSVPVDGREYPLLPTSRILGAVDMYGPVDMYKEANWYLYHVQYASLLEDNQRMANIPSYVATSDPGLLKRLMRHLSMLL